MIDFGAIGRMDLKRLCLTSLLALFVFSCTGAGSPEAEKGIDDDRDRGSPPTEANQNQPTGEAPQAYSFEAVRAKSDSRTDQGPTSMENAEVIRAVNPAQDLTLELRDHIVSISPDSDFNQSPTASSKQVADRARRAIGR